ncbi:hypothetical protein JL720_12219 [Aureococcus anophagefferens]|nr:hypothetical protein JL720_12219 [Aureococcus anophagefferens]
MNVILVLAWLERCVALTVLITGGNGGIGSELAIKFAAAGHDVIVACRGRSAHVHERIVEERLESRARIAGLDVLDDAKVDAFFDSLKAEGVVLDILVNAAGARAASAHISSKLGSIASNTATGGIYAYRMSKSALNAAGKSMAVDLKARGVAVALLVPGYVATPMNGDKGDVTAEASARGLYARIVDDLSLTNSGTFFGTDGAPVPW